MVYHACITAQDSIAMNAASLPGEVEVYVSPKGDITYLEQKFAYKDVFAASFAGLNQVKVLRLKV